MSYYVDIYRIIKRMYLDDHFIETHSHPYYHFIFVLNGNGCVVVNGVNHLVSTNSFIIVPDQTPHSICSGDSFKTIEIKGQLSQSVQSDMAPLGNLVPVLNASEAVLMEEILHEGIGMDPYYKQIINATFMKLLYGIIRRYSKNGALLCGTGAYSPELKNSKLAEVESYIDIHIQDNVTTEELARKMGYNKTYFCTLFKQEVGISPQRYVQQNKIKKAMHYMVTENCNITQIADMLGFNSIHHFSRFFKKYMGCSPNEYLRKLKQDIGINVLNNEFVTQPTSENFYDRVLKPRTFSFDESSWPDK